MSLQALGTVSQNVLQYLQQSQSSDTATTQTQPAASTAVSGTTTPAIMPGGHHHRAGAFFQKIQNAVLSALASAQSSNSTDANSAVTAALTKVLSGTDSDGDNDNSPGAAASPTAPESPAQFFQTLQQYGITPEQFGQDFAAAAQSASSTASANPTIPPGLFVNTIA